MATETDTVHYRFLCRGKTAAELKSENEIPKERELVFETDTTEAKLGDDNTRFVDLPYLNAQMRITVGFDGGGSEIPLNKYQDVYVDRRIELKEWTAVTDQAGELRVDVWAIEEGLYPPDVGDTITGGTGIYLTAAGRAAGSCLLWYPRVIEAGTFLRFAVTTVDSVEKCDIIIGVTKA